MTRVLCTPICFETNLYEITFPTRSFTGTISLVYYSFEQERIKKNKVYLNNDWDLCFLLILCRKKVKATKVGSGIQPQNPGLDKKGFFFCVYSAFMYTHCKTYFKLVENTVHKKLNLRKSLELQTKLLGKRLFNFIDFISFRCTQLPMWRTAVTPQKAGLYSWPNIDFRS